MQTIHDREHTYKGLGTHPHDEKAKPKPLEIPESGAPRETSLFRTHLPRPLMPTYHLLAAFAMLLLALFIAIFYAEFVPI